MRNRKITYSNFDIAPTIKTKKPENIIVRITPRKDVSVYQLGEGFASEDVPFFHKSEIKINIKKIKTYSDIDPEKKPADIMASFDKLKISVSFASLLAAIMLTIGSFSFFGKGIKVESEVLGVSQEAYTSLIAAVESIRNQEFQKSSMEFQSAHDKFSKATDDMNKLGSFLIDATRFFPKISKLSSGKNALEAGRHISLAGAALNDVVDDLYSLKNSNNSEGDEEKSLLDVFMEMQKKLEIAEIELVESKNNLSMVKIDDIPEDKQKEFIFLKEKMPLITASIGGFLKNSNIFIDLLGGNGSRKYLFLFQNNQEMRATGGFIGSYGLMDISNGKVKKFFIDGIFNPDGQLTDKYVPPKPIQKISAAWSMHDSNWFPNFPTSAEKAVAFYEKTGGPTADGIMTLTPTVMEKLLKITGPIEMEEYDVTLDADNFIEKTQYEIEVDYDKEENKPKKILSDLAPIILDKVFNAKDMRSISQTLEVIWEALDQRHILLYSSNDDLQKIISDRGWSGEILESSKDYISVINTNINGFKTDGVINESIRHNSEIQPDGSVVDTVTITRKHNGGNTDFEWWNKVNTNYMRVYVPKGSVLIEASGQTREVVESPLDYEALKFRIDKDVQDEEQGIAIHEESGTRIYEDSGKTVFANWTYVSPQETVTIEYKYMLPFNVLSENGDAYSYHLLAQKQSGSIGSSFVSKIEYPNNLELKWAYPDDAETDNQAIKSESTLDTDRFYGVVLGSEQK